MPIFEYRCTRPDCVNHTRRLEAYVPRYSTPNPRCRRCKSATERLPSTFAIPFDKSLRSYDDPHLENYNPDAEGVVAWRRRSTRNLDGTPERVLLRSVQDQRRYCRDEHLVPPDEVGMVEIGEDGKSLSTAGFKGQWTGLPPGMAQGAEEESELEFEEVLTKTCG